MTSTTQYPTKEGAQWRAARNDVVFNGAIAVTAIAGATLMFWGFLPDHAASGSRTGPGFVFGAAVATIYFRWVAVRPEAELAYRKEWDRLNELTRLEVKAVRARQLVAEIEEAEKRLSRDDESAP